MYNNCVYSKYTLYICKMYTYKHIVNIYIIILYIYIQYMYILHSLFYHWILISKRLLPKYMQVCHSSFRQVLTCKDWRFSFSFMPVSGGCLETPYRNMPPWGLLVCLGIAYSLARWLHLWPYPGGDRSIAPDAFAMRKPWPKWSGMIRRWWLKSGDHQLRNR